MSLRPALLVVLSVLWSVSPVQADDPIVSVEDEMMVGPMNASDCRGMYFLVVRPTDDPLNTLGCYHVLFTLTEARSVSVSLRQISQFEPWVSPNGYCGTDGLTNHGWCPLHWQLLGVRDDGSLLICHVWRPCPEMHDGLIDLQPGEYGVTVSASFNGLFITSTLGQTNPSVSFSLQVG